MKNNYLIRFLPAIAAVLVSCSHLHCDGSLWYRTLRNQYVSMVGLGMAIDFGLRNMNKLPYIAPMMKKIEKSTVGSKVAFLAPVTTWLGRGLWLYGLGNFLYIYASQNYKNSLALEYKDNEYIKKSIENGTYNLNDSKNIESLFYYFRDEVYSLFYECFLKAELSDDAIVKIFQSCIRYNTIQNIKIIIDKGVFGEDLEYASNMLEFQDPLAEKFSRCFFLRSKKLDKLMNLEQAIFEYHEILEKKNLYERFLSEVLSYNRGFLTIVCNFLFKFAHNLNDEKRVKDLGNIIIKIQEHSVFNPLGHIYSLSMQEAFLTNNTIYTSWGDSYKNFNPPRKDVYSSPSIMSWLIQNDIALPKNLVNHPGFKGFVDATQKSNDHIINILDSCEKIQLFWENSIDKNNIVLKQKLLKDIAKFLKDSIGDSNVSDQKIDNLLQAFRYGILSLNNQDKEHISSIKQDILNAILNAHTDFNDAESLYYLWNLKDLGLITEDAFNEYESKSNQKEKGKGKALLFLIGKQRFKIADYLLSYNVDLDIKMQYSNDTALTLAAKKARNYYYYNQECNDLILNLIKKGANLSEYICLGDEKTTLLHLACINGQKKLMEEIIQNHAIRVNALNDKGMTPLLGYFLSGNIQNTRSNCGTIKLLLEPDLTQAKKRYTITNQSLQDTTLLQALLLCNSVFNSFFQPDNKDLDLLIKYSDVNVRTVEGKTPLMILVSQYGTLTPTSVDKVFELLLKYGAKIGLKDKENKTIIDYIEGKNSFDSTMANKLKALLLDHHNIYQTHDMNWHQKDKFYDFKFNYGPEKWTQEQEERYKTKELFKKYVAKHKNKNEIRSNGYREDILDTLPDNKTTALHLVALYGNDTDDFSLADKLLKYYKADPLEKNKKGETPLSLASQNKNNKEIITLFLKNAGDITKLPYDLQECLLKNLDCDYYLRLHELLKLSINQVLDNKGNTLLHAAIIKWGSQDNENKEYVDLIQKILSGTLVNLGQQNDDGDTPLHLILKQKNWFDLVPIITKINRKNNSTMKKAQDAQSIWTITNKEGKTPLDIVDNDVDKVYLQNTFISPSETTEVTENKE